MDPSSIAAYVLKNYSGNRSLSPHFINNCKHYITDKKKRKWDAELHTVMPPDKLEEICSEASVVTSSNSWREFKCKVVIRSFRKAEVVANVCSHYPNLCWRKCGTIIGTYLHMLWSCPKLDI